MLTDKEIEKILRDDLRHTRKCVEESLTVLLEIADDRAMSLWSLDLDASRHSMARAKALALFYGPNKTSGPTFPRGRSVRTVVVLRVLEL